MYVPQGYFLFSIHDFMFLRFFGLFSFETLKEPWTTVKKIFSFGPRPLEFKDPKIQRLIYCINLNTCHVMFQKLLKFFGTHVSSSVK